MRRWHSELTASLVRKAKMEMCVSCGEKSMSGALDARIGEDRRNFGGRFRRVRAAGRSARGRKNKATGNAFA